MCCAMLYGGLERHDEHLIALNEGLIPNNEIPNG